jgi:hypothetical protein
LAVVASVRASLPCSTKAIRAILPANASLLYAIPNGANSSFGNQSDIAFPLNATGLPAFCAIQVNVSQPHSSFVVAIWLPVQWNQRLMTVGNGGYTGGVNYPSMGSNGLHYGFATVSTDLGTTARSWSQTLLSDRSNLVQAIIQPRVMHHGPWVILKRSSILVVAPSTAQSS